jgi:hypothetical protein
VGAAQRHLLLAAENTLRHEEPPTLHALQLQPSLANRTRPTSGPAQRPPGLPAPPPTSPKSARSRSGVPEAQAPKGRARPQTRAGGVSRPVPSRQVTAGAAVSVDTIPPRRKPSPTSPGQDGLLGRVLGCTPHYRVVSCDPSDHDGLRRSHNDGQHDREDYGRPDKDLAKRTIQIASCRPPASHLSTRGRCPRGATDRRLDSSRRSIAQMPMCRRSGDVPRPVQSARDSPSEKQQPQPADD